MNKYNKIFFCCLSVVLIFVSMCPSAFAVDHIYSVPMNQPVHDDSHGYVEFLIKQKNVDYYMTYVYFFDYSLYYAKDVEQSVLPTEDILTQKFTVSSSGASLRFSLVDSRYTCYLGVGSMNNQGRTNYFYTSFYVDGSSYSYTYDFEFSSDWEIVGYRLNSDFFVVNDQLTTNTPFTIVYSEDIPEYQSLLSVITLLGNIISNDEQLLSSFQDLLADTNTLIQNTDNIESSLDVVNEYLKGISGYLTTYLPEISEYLEFIRDYVKIYLPNIEEVLWYIDTDILVVHEKLDKIIEILESSGESNLTSPDTSNLDNYYEIEQSLVNNSNVDVSGAVNVQIDHNAMVFTWNLVETIMNSNGKVFGLTLTVLSLGIIALILGR